MSAGNMGPEEVVTVSTDATVGDAAQTLEAENVGAAVVTEGDSPVGVVTDRDIALEVPGSEDLESRPVDDVMTEDPVTIREDESPMEISRTIDEHNVRRIPIVDENEELTGIATLDDLVATVGEQLDNVTDTIEAQSPDYSP